MRRAWLLACWAFVGGAVALACGGSGDSGLFGSSGDTTGSSSGSTSSGATASSSGATSSSGTTSSGGTTTSSGGTTTSSGGSSGGSVVDAGVDAGKSCRRDFSAQDCASGEYCKVINCADKGFCTTKPAPKGPGDIVCGCDGISYWNLELAASFGVNVNPAFQSECTGNAAKTCSAVNACPTNRHCNYQTTASTGGVCSVATTGTCWGLPNPCPAVTDGRAKECNSTDPCKSFCEAVKAQKPWYPEVANKCN